MKNVLITSIIFLSLTLTSHSQVFTSFYEPDDPYINLYDLCVYNNTEIAACGLNGNFEKLIVYTNGNWVAEHSEGGVFGLFYSLAYIAPNTMWAAGAETLIVYDSNGYWSSPSAFPTVYYKDIRDLLFFKSNDGWAAGTRGYISRDIKGTWKLISDTAIHGNFNIYNLFGTSDYNVFISGQDTGSLNQARLYHYNGINFTQKMLLPSLATDICNVPGDTTKYLMTFKGSGTGQKGLYEYNTATNTLTPILTDYGYNCVIAFSGGKIIVGGDGNSF